MKADLHVHTSFSYDGISSPKEMVISAIEKGIDCICITDHNEIRGAVEAMKFGFDKDILIIPGIEILTTSGDILGINVKNIIPDGLPAVEAIKRIRKEGGIAVIPHPFRPFLLSFKGITEIKADTVDAIEVFNSYNIVNSSNKRAWDFSQKNNLCFTAGSDAHRKEFIGRGYIELPEKISSERDLIEEIVNKKSIIGGKTLSLFEILRNSKEIVKIRTLKESFNYWQLFKKKKIKNV